jgi:hypothetical protein
VASGRGQARTSGDLGACGRERVDSLLDVGDARRQVGAAREELDLLAEVVHGRWMVDGGWCRRRAAGNGYARARARAGEWAERTWGSGSELWTVQQMRLV